MEFEKVCEGKVTSYRYGENELIHVIDSGMHRQAWISGINIHDAEYIAELDPRAKVEDIMPGLAADIRVIRTMKESLGTVQIKREDLPFPEESLRQFTFNSL